MTYDITNQQYSEVKTVTQTDIINFPGPVSVSSQNWVNIAGGMWTVGTVGVGLDPSILAYTLKSGSVVCNANFHNIPAWTPLADLKTSALAYLSGPKIFAMSGGSLTSGEASQYMTRVGFAQKSVI